MKITVPAKDVAKLDGIITRLENEKLQSESCIGQTLFDLCADNPKQCRDIIKKICTEIMSTQTYIIITTYDGFGHLSPQIKKAFETNDLKKIFNILNNILKDENNLFVDGQGDEQLSKFRENFILSVQSIVQKLEPIIDILNRIRENDMFLIEKQAEDFEIELDGIFGFFGKSIPPLDSEEFMIIGQHISEIVQCQKFYEVIFREPLFYPYALEVKEAIENNDMIKLFVILNEIGDNFDGVFKNKNISEDDKYLIENMSIFGFFVLENKLFENIIRRSPSLLKSECDKILSLSVGELKNGQLSVSIKNSHILKHFVYRLTKHRSDDLLQYDLQGFIEGGNKGLTKKFLFYIINSFGKTKDPAEKVVYDFAINLKEKLGIEISL